MFAGKNKILLLFIEKVTTRTCAAIMLEIYSTFYHKSYGNYYFIADPV